MNPPSSPLFEHIKMPSRRTLLKSLALALPFSFTGHSQMAKAAEKKSRATPLLRFTIASDGHLGQKNTPSEMYFANLIKWINQENEDDGLDFLIFNGDLIHDDAKYLPEVKNYFKQLKIPVYPVQGNHDMVSHTEWKEFWDQPVNNSFMWGNNAFLVMTTSDETGEFQCGNKEWLAAELQRYADVENIFLFLHISQNSWTKHGVDCPEVMNMITEAPNVKAIFHGHDHQEDGVKYYKDKPFFWSGHTGGNWGQEYKGYRVVELYSEKMETYMVNPLGKRKINHQKSWKQQIDNN